MLCVLNNKVNLDFENITHVNSKSFNNKKLFLIYFHFIHQFDTFSKFID